MRTFQCRNLNSERRVAPRVDQLKYSLVQPTLAELVPRQSQRVAKSIFHMNSVVINYKPIGVPK